MDTLRIAVLTGISELVESILKKNPEMVRMADSNGESLLLFALSNVSDVESRLKVDPDVGRLARLCGDNVIFGEEGSRLLDVVKILLDYNANCCVQDKRKETPLHYAAYDGNDKIVEILLEKCPQLVGMKNENDSTALHYAALYGHLKVVKILLDYNANCCVQDKRKDTPLHCAACKGNDKIVQILLKTCPQLVDMKNAADYTGLHYAADGHLKVVEILLENGASVMSKTGLGRLPIDIAAENGHTVTFLKLWDKMGQENIMSSDNLLKSLLKLSVAGNHWSIVKFLLPKFAIFSESDSGNQTATCDFKNATFITKLSLFLDCLSDKSKDISAKWTCSQLQLRVNEYYSGKSFSSDVPFLYLIPNQRREAIIKMKKSVEELTMFVDDVIKWNSDVIPFILERLNEVEELVVKDEILFLLHKNNYFLENNGSSSLLTSKTNPLELNVRSTAGLHKAIIYFNTSDPNQNVLFESHVKRLSKFTHPNVLGFKESIKDDHHSIIIIRCETDCISLEYKITKDSSSMSADIILTIFKQIVQSIDALHNRNIMHSSIKPSNIFIDDSNYVRIGDLSSSTDISDSLSAVAVSTVPSAAVDSIYSAPEIRDTRTNEQVGVSSDIWSLGCVLFKMITGENYSAQCDFRMDEIKMMQEHTKDFIEAMIELLKEMILLDADQRSAASAILQHPIFEGVSVPQKKDHLYTYARKNILGRGAFGEVEFQQDYAVKRPLQNEVAQNLFEKEKELTYYVACSSRSDGVSATVLRDSEQLLHQSLKMEYCEKGNLKNLISSKGQVRLTELEFVSYAFQITAAVVHLHQLNIMHRDIKPGNFVITGRNKVKIIDFGLAVMVSPGEKCRGRVGTLNYMAPEVDQCKEYDKSADIYSLGCTIYELLTLRSVVDDRKNCRFMEFEGKEDVTEIVNQINKLLSDDPKERPAMEDSCRMLVNKCVKVICNLELWLFDKGNVLLCEAFSRSWYFFWENRLLNQNPKLVYGEPEFKKLRNDKGFEICDFVLAVSHSMYNTTQSSQSDPLILQNYVDVDRVEIFGLTALQRAVREGKYEMVEKLLHIFPILVHMKNEDGFTSLHYAAGAGYVNIVELLLKYGASVDVQEKHGFTPFLFALLNGRVKMVERLLQMFPKFVNMKDEDGFTSLHYAVGAGYVNIVELLLKYGASVDVKGMHGFTPLLCAVMNDRFEMFSKLMNMENEADFTSRHCAAGEGHKKIVELLLKYGASVDVLEKHGFTPF